VPRHPDRADDIEADLVAQGLQVSRRSLGHDITPGTDVYLADTMGELGLFYRIAPIVFMGKTLSAGGGQNPLEPARLNCAILHGPDMSNFAAISTEMLANGACRPVTDADDLVRQVAALLRDPDSAGKIAKAALDYANSKAEVLDRTLDALRPLLAQKGIKEAHDA